MVTNYLRLTNTISALSRREEAGAQLLCGGGAIATAVVASLLLSDPIHPSHREPVAALSRVHGQTVEKIPPF